MACAAAARVAALPRALALLRALPRVAAAARPQLGSWAQVQVGAWRLPGTATALPSGQSVLLPPGAVPLWHLSGALQCRGVPAGDPCTSSPASEVAGELSEGPSAALPAAPLWCKGGRNKATKLAARKKRRRMGERVSLRYR